MATSADRGKEVRARLVGAAAELIGERGWSGVSTRLLAERAGVGPGLVHYHFASLKALLEEAALGTIGAVADEATARIGPGVGLEEGLTLLLESLDSYTGADPLSCLFTEAYLTAARDPGLRVGITEVLGRFRTAIAAWLDACGVEAPEATAAVVAAAVDGMMLHRALDPGLTSESVAPILRRLITP